jgi:hypothetical protein
MPRSCPVVSGQLLDSTCHTDTLVVGPISMSVPRVPGADDWRVYHYIADEDTARRA